MTGTFGKGTFLVEKEGAGVVPDKGRGKEEHPGKEGNLRASRGKRSIGICSHCMGREDLGKGGQPGEGAWTQNKRGGGKEK